VSRVALVVAVARNGVIGRGGGLPWHISSDLKRFKQITMGNPVIMGRKTWESLPRKPLAGRTNIVFTRDPAYRAEGAKVVRDATTALALAEAEDPPEIAVIGGGEIYRLFLDRTDRIYLTDIDADVEGDTLFPKLAEDEWRETSREEHARGPNDSHPFTLRILDRIRR
jgi:dihydrofolate reductase